MRGWAAYLMALLLAVCVAPAAASVDAGGFCSAASSSGESLAAAWNDRSRWSCTPSSPSLAPERTILAMPIARGAALPKSFATRASMMGGLSMALVHDGIVGSATRHPASSLVAQQGNTIVLPLPAGASGGDTLLVAFDRPTVPGLFSAARLIGAAPPTSQALFRLVLAAIVCGMLLMPLAFNAAYYRVLRERFVLWHLALTLGLLGQCMLESGILGMGIAMPLPIYARLGIVSFGISVAAAAGFAAAFIEPGKLHPALRRSLYVAAMGVTVISMIHAFLPNLLRPVHTAAYYAAFIPVLVLFVIAMADAWRRGSRAVRFQLIGWAPFVAVGVVRIATLLLPGWEQNDAMPLYYLAMVVESVATSLGVADRFMIIKRQRDRALTRAQSLERLSERDDLTGLYNRRALDGRLGDFAVQQFTGFALFDLDNFKRVNDTHGHAVGDAVLRTVASVLDGHDDAVALRMGGEEFLLLLRGGNVSERVERLREAIPVRIAREVAELEILVTASAGLIEAAPDYDVGSDFVALYRTADDLLYEAKHNGRNMLAAVSLPVAQPAGQTEAIAAA